MSESLLIVGTGAMACLYAAQLAQAGIRITMLGTWAEGIAALNRHGVRLVQPDGTEKTVPVHATSETQECAGASSALVLVKSWQTQRAARQLARCLTDDGIALTLQNGLGNRETLAKELGSNRVALGVTTTGATLLGPGRVRPGGEGVISLGVHAHLKLLAELLRKANFLIETVPDTNVLLWGKLVINAGINPLTALLHVPNGELLERPTARSLMATTAREAAAVAVGQGIQLPYPDPVVATESVARRTASNHSSMLQDVMRHAPTEIDAICGAIVTTGEETETPTPVNRALWQLVKALVA